MQRRRVLGVLVATAVGCLMAAVTAQAGGNAGQHSGIAITSDHDFTSCTCVTSGDGTPGHPYVIGPWAITSPAGGSAVAVSGTIHSYFVIAGISANYNDPDPSHPVIHLSGITNPTTISNVSANADGIGVELDNSNDITLDNINVNKMVGAGLIINNSTNVSVANAKWKATADGESPHNEDGLYAVNSSGLSIGTAPDCPRSAPCNTFDYDSGWGVYLQDTHDVTISNASANADDTGGYVLDGQGTYNVTLTGSTAEAGGPICISLNGQKVHTGYYTDLIGGLMLVNGTHNNTIANDTFNGTSTAAGYSIGSGGNGFYFDPCASMRYPFSPVERPMGPANNFSNICYGTTDASGLPQSTCTS